MDRARVTRKGGPPVVGPPGSPVLLCVGLDERKGLQSSRPDDRLRPSFRANSGLLVRQNPKSPRSCYGLGATVDTELAIDVAGVGLDRVQGEEKAGSNLGIGQPLSDEFQHLKLAFAQGLDQFDIGGGNC